MSSLVWFSRPVVSREAMFLWYFTTVFKLFFVVVIVSTYFYVKLFVTILTVLCH